jgi:nitroimidazol reductase NimA-like FMN-containing flavoprotein (pyridoxamine 5'-phosphate oxidase superfamily)/DNA-binding HxlR family transcriptional regulator
VGKNLHDEQRPEGTSCEALAAVFALLGKRWSGVILGTLLSGPARWTEIFRQVHGVSERMLSSRLTELIAAGLIQRTVVAGPPVGVVYRLTERGEALRPALAELGRWATEHLHANVDSPDSPDSPNLPDSPDSPDETLATTPRGTLRRKRERGSYERALINSILDEALVCHVGFHAHHGPVVLPMTYARIGDDLFLHGAGGNDMLRHLAGGTDLCITVTLLDGLVFARSAFHHSMNYRCVVLFGRAERVTDPAEMVAASACLLDHLAPGRSLEARLPTAAELRSTLMVRIPISEGSAKVRTGGPIEDPDDLDLPVWAGELPLALTARAPIPDAGTADRRPVPSSIIHLAGEH